MSAMALNAEQVASCSMDDKDYSALDLFAKSTFGGIPRDLISSGPSTTDVESGAAQRPLFDGPESFIDGPSTSSKANDEQPSDFRRMARAASLTAQFGFGDCTSAAVVETGKRYRLTFASLVDELATVFKENHDTICTQLFALLASSTSSEHLQMEVCRNVCALIFVLFAAD